MIIFGQNGIDGWIMDGIFIRLWFPSYFAKKAPLIKPLNKYSIKPALDMKATRNLQST
jgi:hypothetical protein